MKLTLTETKRMTLPQILYFRTVVVFTLNIKTWHRLLSLSLCPSNAPESVAKFHNHHSHGAPLPVRKAKVCCEQIDLVFTLFSSLLVCSVFRTSSSSFFWSISCTIAFVSRLFVFSRSVQLALFATVRHLILKTNSMNCVFLARRAHMFLEQMHVFA